MKRITPGDTVGSLRALSNSKWECLQCGHSFDMPLNKVMRKQLDLYGCPSCRKQILKARKAALLELELVGQTIHNLEIKRIEYRKAPELRLDGHERPTTWWKQSKPYAICTCKLCGREYSTLVAELRRKRSEGCVYCTKKSNAQKVRIIQTNENGQPVLNVRTGRNNHSGRTGVSYIQATRSYMATLGTEYLGIFPTFEEAVAAREAAEQKALEEAREIDD